VARGFTSIRETRPWRAAALAVVLAFLTCIDSTARGADRPAHAPDAPLVKLALARFHALTRAERAMLEFAQVGNVDRGHFAVAVPSSNPDDSSNDPAHASEWGRDREIRGSLIRWLCVDPDAVKMIDPKGIRILGGRIVETLDLSNVRVPFGLTLRRCLIPEPMNLSLAELASLDLGGSFVNEIDAKAIDVRGDVDLDDGFRSSGLVRFDSARIGGDLNCAGGSFTHSAASPKSLWAALTPALTLSWTRVGGTAFLCCGFRSDGAVMFDEANIRNLMCFGGRFINPGKNAP
jgi:hypothetical protein